jgi:hypothetical protein
VGPEIVEPTEEECRNDHVDEPDARDPFGAAQVAVGPPFLGLRVRMSSASSSSAASVTSPTRLLPASPAKSAESSNSAPVAMRRQFGSGSSSGASIAAIRARGTVYQRVLAPILGMSCANSAMSSGRRARRSSRRSARVSRTVSRAYHRAPSAATAERTLAIAVTTPTPPDSGSRRSLLPSPRLSGCGVAGGPRRGHALPISVPGAGA